MSPDGGAGARAADRPEETRAREESPGPQAWKDRKAAWFLPSLDGGGAERTCVAIGSWLVDQGAAVDIVLARARGPVLALVPSQVRVVDLGARKTATSLPGLLEYLRREQPEVVVSSLNASVVALAAKRFFLPRQRVVSYYASVFSEEFRHGPPKTRLMMRAFRRLLPAADAVVVGSRGAEQDLARLAPDIASRLKVVRRPVDVERLDAPPAHPWFQAPGPPIVVSVGRLDAGKDFATVIRAFGEVRRRGPARLVVLGEGPLRGALEALVRDLKLEGSVHLPGFVANPLAYMAHAQVFAFGSRFEGFARVVVEALACGTPVVSADCPHGPAEILGGGKWGRLVPVGDWRAMAGAVLAAMEDPPPPVFLQQRARAFSSEALGPRWAEAIFGVRAETGAGAA